MTMHPRNAALTALLGALCAALVPSGTARAVLPPRDCGVIEVRDRPWQIKADQVRCRPAKRYARAYIRTREEPPAYDCRRGPSGSRLFAQCTARSYAPDRVIYIIRRS